MDKLCHNCVAIGKGNECSRAFSTKPLEILGGKPSTFLVEAIKGGKDQLRAAHSVAAGPKPKTPSSSHHQGIRTLPGRSYAEHPNSICWLTTVRNAQTHGRDWNYPILANGVKTKIVN